MKLCSPRWQCIIILRSRTSKSHTPIQNTFAFVQATFHSEKVGSLRARVVFNQSKLPELQAGVGLRYDVLSRERDVLVLEWYPHPLKHYAFSSTGDPLGGANGITTQLWSIAAFVLPTVVCLCGETRKKGGGRGARKSGGSSCSSSTGIHCQHHTSHRAIDRGTPNSWRPTSIPAFRFISNVPCRCLHLHSQ